MSKTKYSALGMRKCSDDDKENMKALRILNASLPKHSIKVDIVA